MTDKVSVWQERKRICCTERGCPREMRIGKTYATSGSILKENGVVLGDMGAFDMLEDQEE